MGRPARSATARAFCAASPAEFFRARAETAQAEATAVGAEAVGQDDVGAGVDEALVQRANALRMRLVPKLGAIARSEAGFDQVGSGGAVGEQRPPFGDQFGQHIFPFIGPPAVRPCLVQPQSIPRPGSVSV